MGGITFVPEERRSQKIADIKRIFNLSDDSATISVAIDIAHAIAKAKEANANVKPVLWDGNEIKEIQL